MISGACAPAPPPAEVPQAAFEAQGVTLEQMDDGRVVWRASVARAFGEVGRTELREIVLRTDPTLGQGPLVLRAPRAEVDRGAGTIELSEVEVEVEEGRGAILRAPAATYDERAQAVRVHGPVRMESLGLQATAAGAAIDLVAGRVDLQGPVRGRWDGSAGGAAAP